MAKMPGFAKACAGRWRIVELDTCDGNRPSLRARWVLQQPASIVVC